MAIDGFDDFDPDVRAGLVCHIEMDVSGGRTSREVAASTAEQLRLVAAQIESGELDTGHHPLKTEDKNTVGEVYLDFYGEA